MSPAEQFLYNELELGIKGSANLRRSQQREIIRRLRDHTQLLAALKRMGKQCRDSNEPTAISIRLQISELIGSVEGAK